MQGTTDPAPSASYKGNAGGIRIKPSIMGVSDGNTLVKGDKMTGLAIKTGPDGVSAISDIYAYICINADGSNKIVGKSDKFNWPGINSYIVNITFGKNGFTIDPDTTYTIVFSRANKDIGDTTTSSDWEKIRVPLVPVESSSDFCCLRGDNFNPLLGSQLAEMAFTYTRNISEVSIAEKYSDILNAQWKLNIDQVQGYGI